MAEAVSNGLVRGGDVSPLAPSPASAAWDWKRHLREFPKYSPIVAQEGPSVGLSFGEQRIWVISSADSGAIAYNVPLAWRVTGPLDLEALSWSLNRIVERHEALRTCYREAQGEVLPCVINDQLVVVTTDLRTVPDNDRCFQLEKCILDEVRRPFDLSRDLMLHAAAFRTTDTEGTLVLTVHHIAADGPAMGVLLQELAHFYSAAVTGVSPTLPPPVMQCRDFTRWQREALTDEIKQKQLAYWSEQLKGVPAVLELPSDTHLRTTSGFEGGIEYRSLSPELSNAFKTLSRRSGVTTFMGLLAAYQALLSRYSGQSDIVVGSAMTHRTREETSKSIGFFSNMMALRTQFHEDLTFRELLKRVRGVSLGAYANQDVPFEAVVAALRPERAPGRNPLFQALINYEDATWHELNLSGTKSVEVPVHNGTAKFDLSLCIVDCVKGFHLSLEYNSALMDAQMARRMLASLETMMESAVVDANIRVSDLPLLTEAERREVVTRWNQTKLDFPQNATIHEQIEAQAERTPEAVALEFGERSLTYKQLMNHVNHLAWVLCRAGITRETLVGICAERSIEMVVAMIAVLKAGGAYVPFDPAHPMQRRIGLIRDSGLQFLLTFKAAFDTNELTPAVRMISLEHTSGQGTEDAATQIESPASSRNLAYVIFTSGSTGKPKAVQIEHRAVVNFFAALNQAGAISAEDVVLAISTPTFDIAVLELLYPLTIGSRVVVASREEVTDGRLLIEALHRSHATVVQATPTSWRMLIAAGWKGTRRLHAFSGGEPLSRGLADEILDRCDSLHNMYGLTETGIWSSMHEVERNDVRSVSIGHPIANNRFYALDARLNPVPMGVPGELYIGGDGLSRGYLNAEDVTRERFIREPFVGDEGARMYRSGDLVRQRPDGAFEYLSRVDRQVKVRGHRIELGEVESALNQHPLVHQATIAAREDASTGKRLVAYIVPKSCSQDAVNNECTETVASRIRASLRETLPEYMVPSAFVFLESLPLTSSGKIDLKALPVPDDMRTEAGFVAPRDELEEQLTGIWEECLNTHPVGINDNFFDLGGHSVLGATLLTRIEKEFGKRLTLATLFQAPTVERLAAILKLQGWSSPWLVQVQAGTSSKPPLFFVHARMGYRALAAELGSEHTVYAVPYDNLFENQTERTMQDIALELVDKIRTVQPKGPYFLGGVCLAGRVAYAIARELYRLGEEVALLAIFDSAAPGYAPQSTTEKVWLKAGHIKWHLQRFVHGDRQQKKAFFVEMRWHMINRVWWSGNALFRWMGRPLPGFLRQQFRLTARAAITDREVIPYPGHVALFRPAERPMGRYDDSDLGWKQIAVGGVDVFEVPGDHKHVLLPPNVTIVAQELKKSLDKALTTVASRTAA
ncbi:MAG TPA: amino acid adenylation domain-containing protein [Terriglobales bacterium]|jgi:amino acid adenylation domain-containing protein